MNILEYNDLKVGKSRDQYKKIVEMLRKDDLYSSEVKKMKNHNLYRAKLNHEDRLLFKIETYNGERYALILDIILDHKYESSKFLRGRKVREADFTETLKNSDCTTHGDEGFLDEKLHYINKKDRKFHLLDKIISFDELQKKIYHINPPIIIIGSAGSGKTALTLEKMKRMDGKVLYITLSPYLAQRSREIYFSYDFMNENQDVDFLHFREFIESIDIPEGKEATYYDFRSWSRRLSLGKQMKGVDTNKLYEEFKGVLTGHGHDKKYLSMEEYKELGVRQSIFDLNKREKVYQIFKKYLDYLEKYNLYDSNMICYDLFPKVSATYDFIVVDEVQDLTNIQINLILKSLKSREQFLLCGDSHQIVHPNFFSWAKLKSLFYHKKERAGDFSGESECIHILHANYRNSQKVTYLSNQLPLQPTA